MCNKFFWNKVAVFYKAFMLNNNKLYKDACKLIEPHLKKDMKVLELACGTGQFTKTLWPFVFKWIASDFSQKMVQLAKRNIKNNNVSFKVIDATKIPYKNNTFDVVFIANALHIMPNPHLALEEIKRILKPNGILIAPTFIYGEGNLNFKMWFLKKIGFKIFSQWESDDLSQFISQNGFVVKYTKTIKYNSLSECVLIAIKK